jgi:hypothetical protein
MVVQVLFGKDEGIDDNVMQAAHSSVLAFSQHIGRVANVRF